MDGKEFKNRREMLGLTRKAFCELVGFDYRTVIGWESKVKPRGYPPAWIEQITAFWLVDKKAFEAFKTFERARKKIRA